MLRTFELVDDISDVTEPRVILQYNEEKDLFSIDIPESVCINHLPAILSLLVKQRVKHLDDSWSRKFIKERIDARHWEISCNLEQQIKIRKLTDFQILEYTKGRCCMDDFYLQEITVSHKVSNRKEYSFESIS